jgi:hypothetical protein
MAYNAGLAAITQWKEDYADLRLSFDRSLLDASLLAFLRSEMADDITGADEDTIYTIICVAFVKLLQRGAVEPIRPLSSEGERQLAELRSSFNVVSGDRPVDPELTAYDRVLEAFNGNKTPMSEIRKLRKDPQFEAAYVKALENGDIK